VKAPSTSAVEMDNLAAQLTKPAVTPYYPPSPPPGSGEHRYGDQHFVIVAFCYL
jgi:phosphatidylethanolamine-binding protein (PEBP) family uncharacterized protein